MEYILDRGMRILPETSWRPVFQRSIDAFYEGRNEEGIAACLMLLQAPELPDHIRELTYRNQTYYARPLDELVPGARWQAVAAPTPEGWTARDPSPAIAGDRFVVILGGVPGEEASASEAPPLEELSGMELVVLRDDEGGRARLTEPRPFFVGEALHVAALMREREEQGRDRAAVIALGAGAPGDARLFGPRPGNFRQGWSPVVTPVGPRFVSWWEPTEVWRFDEEGGEFARVALRVAPHVAERFQGGSQGVPVPGGYLFLVNETLTFDSGKEIVLSRFIRCDDGFQIGDVSPQFFLTERGRDVATGLARRGETLIAGFTAAGSLPVLATINLDAVLRALTPVSAPGKHAAAAATG